MSNRKPLILHVDDDEANRYAVTRSLIKAGFNVVEAANGTTALEKMREQPELVILDIRLPDIDGFEVCRRIKADPATTSVPILHLSASFVSSESKAQGLDGGADGYLVRPVEPVELIATVNALLRTKASEDALRKIEAQNVILINELHTALAERNALLASEQTARREAEHAGTMKDQFLATLSHELRTPLNAILGWATILRASEQDGGAELRDGLEAIERNARAQTQIIEDLLDMSRIISGKVRLIPQNTELSAVLNSAIETMRPAAVAKGVRIDSQYESIAGPIWGDASRLQQVFWNLLSNAIKFTGSSGRITVTVAQAAANVKIEITDSGEGINPAFLPFVFDRFRQADGSTTRRHGGLGLGLAIVKQLVELHGGQVNVKSEGLGLGSTFTVSLPTRSGLRENEPIEPSCHRGTANIASDSGEACSKLAGLKVVVVDDESDGRFIVSRYLANCGVEVFAASSSEEGFQLIITHCPDVVISDIAMPNENGYTLMKRVRALGGDSGSAVPAIALTAYARSEDKDQAVAAGYQHHLSKPVERSDLILLVAKLSGRIESK